MCTHSGLTLECQISYAMESDWEINRITDSFHSLLTTNPDGYFVLSFSFFCTLSCFCWREIIWKQVIYNLQRTLKKTPLVWLLSPTCNGTATINFYELLSLYPVWLFFLPFFLHLKVAVMLNLARICSLNCPHPLMVIIFSSLGKQAVFDLVGALISAGTQCCWKLTTLIIKSRLCQF